MIQETFLRFWKAQRNASASFSSRFPDLRAVMSYLKRCAVAMRIEAWREEERSARLHERLCDERHLEHLHRPPAGKKTFDLRLLISSKFNSEEERVVFELTYYFDLPPRDIQAERPDLFPDVNLVYRVKENLLKRLRRDPELEAYWSGREGA
jgi:DNA-directed RNA polymerase specialized sigma24 family protein